MAEAERPVYKHLRLHTGVLRDKANFLQVQLSGQDHPGNSHLCRRFRSGKIVDAHLGTGMKRDIRKRFMDHAGQAEILDQDRIRALVRGKPRRSQRGRHFPVIDQGVQRHIDAAGAKVAIAYRLLKFFRCKVMCTPSGIKIPKAEIDRIRAVLHRCNDGFRGSCRGKQFHHDYTPDIWKRVILSDYSTFFPIATR